MRLFALGAVAVLLATASSNGDEAKDILEATGVKGGLVVHLGCGDGKLTAALHPNDSYVVQGLDADVTAARKYIQSLGLYGPVSVEQWTGERLPYIDNLVNLIVANCLGKVPMSEVMRVLAPNGIAFIGGKKTIKAWPKDIDEWTHYLHDPSNNAVAHDSEIGPPRHMQWLGNPTWTRNHNKVCSISSVVSAEGRVFCIVDEATAADLDVPGKWFVVARDGFSGIQLWEKPMASWISTKIPFRTGPPQVTRLLVASGDRLYVPLGLNAPVSELDAATGKTLRTFEATSGAEEIVLVNGVLLVIKGEPVAERRDTRASRDFSDCPTPRPPSLLTRSPARPCGRGRIPTRVCDPRRLGRTDKKRLCRLVRVSFAWSSSRANLCGRPMEPGNKRRIASQPRKNAAWAYRTASTLWSWRTTWCFAI